MKIDKGSDEISRVARQPAAATVSGWFVSDCYTAWTNTCDVVSVVLSDSSVRPASPWLGVSL
jgi:hypothetical protein